MAFCGQCGLLLPPGAAHCPRCGIETQYNTIAQETYANDATVISHPDLPPAGALPHTTDSGTQRDATPLPDVPDYLQNRSLKTAHTPPYGMNTPFPPAGVSYPGTPQRSGDGYPAQGVSYPSFAPPTGAGYSTGAPGPVRRPRRWALALFIPLVLLLIIITGVLVFLRPDQLQSMLGGHTPTPIATPQPTSIPPTAQPSPATQPPPTAPPSPTTQPTATTPAPTPAQQAQAVIEQYYADINNKDYQDAYNLWVNYPQSYSTFAQGFAHTRHDDITFRAVTPQSDGTVRLDLTLTATSDTLQQNVYQGYYIVGQQPDGSWKITTANFQQVSSG